MWKICAGSVHRHRRESRGLCSCRLADGRQRSEATAGSASTADCLHWDSNSCCRLNTVTEQKQRTLIPVTFLKNLSSIGVSALTSRHMLLILGFSFQSFFHQSKWKVYSPSCSMFHFLHQLCLCGVWCWAGTVLWVYQHLWLKATYQWD